MGRKPRAASALPIFRSILSSELNGLAKVVSSTGGRINGSRQIDAAVASILSDKRDVWMYHIEKLVFQAEQKSIAIPVAGKLKTIALGIDVRGELTEQLPMRHMQINIELEGVSERGDVSVHFAWHFDRHADGGNPAIGAHPKFHAQHAGQRVESLNRDWGAALFCDAPRLVHPPLDAVLAIDFVAGNYCPNLWSDLRRDPTFTGLLRTSIHRYWRPYANTIAKSFEDDTFFEEALGLWPSLLPREKVS